MLTGTSDWILRVLYRTRARNARGIIVNNHALSTGQTCRLVDLLAKRFDFIAMDDLARHLEKGARKPFCILTFDDGRRSNATEAAPELLRLGVPAAFYLTTSFVNGGKPLWFDRYAALKEAMRPLPEALTLSVLKQLPLRVLEERLDEYCHRAKLELEFRSEDLRPMSWEEAKWLVHRGFTVGAHAVEHTVLTREPLPSAVASIRESISIVTREIGRPCESFAFPNGNYTATLCRAALHSGAKTVMTTEPMWVTADASFWRLPRIQLFPQQSAAKMTLKLALALQNGVLTNPDGTGRAYRRIEALKRRARKKWAPSSQTSDTARCQAR